MAMVVQFLSTLSLRLGLLLIFFLGSAYLFSQEDDERRSESFVIIDPEGKKGFMFGANIGYYLANDEPARFYDGTPKGDNFLDLNEFLNIDYIRQEVIDALGNNTTSFQLVEYASDVRYNNVINFGGHLRYQFNWANAIVADVNFSAMRVDDFFVLSYANDNGTSQDIFQNFPISGTEDRLFVSAGYQVNLGPPSAAGLNFEFGPEMVSVKVKTNSFSIASRRYSILRAQTIGPGNQLLNNDIPTLTYIGAYAQFAANLEFDKFTIDLGLRSSLQKIELSESILSKRRLSYTPFARLVYRVTVKGF
jgi:hypothetical protein